MIHTKLPPKYAMPIKLSAKNENYNLNIFGDVLENIPLYAHYNSHKHLTIQMTHSNGLINTVVYLLMCVQHHAE